MFPKKYFPGAGGTGTGEPYPVYYKDIEMVAVTAEQSFSVEVVEQSVDDSEVEMSTVDTDLTVDNPTITMETE